MNAMISIATLEDQMHFAKARSIYEESRNMGQHATHVVGTAGLPKAFNILWAGALEARAKGVSHFAMIHSDIAAERFWLDKMGEIMTRVGADVLSVVSPLKSHEGLTSTAIDTENRFKVKRFSLHEIHAMEPTFTRPGLLVNTGLMLVDMRKPWVEKMHFYFDDQIIDGRATSSPEDWNFSRDARALGASIWATREVQLQHFGPAAYSNAHPWGTLKTDTYNGSALV